ncbi:DUF5753 domain-containing protein [Nocardiopsis sp. CNR-923]|uniref:DUF5753 domain-containing protein n=1 Tax=Nocardiopsis sp. CNR-923 TaxID=1904965 RepID=UPI0021CCE5AC|nr:DUF5753 domain-containing protein [Nocardiopsis sp. CNR-923]
MWLARRSGTEDRVRRAVRRASGTRTRQQSAVESEGLSRHVQIFESVCVPGLFQTVDYARYMIQRVVDLHGLPDDVEEGVRKRMERRRVLDDRSREFQTLIWEPALRMRQFPESVLFDQLNDLADSVRRGRGGIGIVPLDAGLTTSPMHGF